MRRIYAKHQDVDAYLAQSAQQTPLWTMRRSLVERLMRPAPGEQANEQLRQQQLGRLKPSAKQ